MRGRTHWIPLPSTRRVAWLLFLLSVIPRLPPPLSADAGPIMVRVLLRQDLSTFAVSVPPVYTIHTSPAGLLPAEAATRRTLSVRAKDGHLRLDGTNIDLTAIDILPRHPGALLFVADKLYRGGLTIKGREAGLIVVNTLDLEQYLYGVLPNEAPAQWKMAALRAQAIVARTYTLYKRAHQESSDYDVSAQYVRDQHYEGYSAENPRTNQAVDETRGIVITCHGALLPAYYHAESAGSTENSEDVWSAANPCLRAVKAPMYPDSPYLHWSATISLQDMRTALLRHGYLVGPIVGLEPVQRSPTGRIIVLKILHGLGETVLRGTDFRLALGPEIVRSTLFTVQVHDGRAFFTGQGWGHGVGLCQWCSEGMAQHGYSDEAILRYYYRGAQLARYR